jgi:poly-gamma-glutamate synthesis protein (capsule biosynthesis protein)
LPRPGEIAVMDKFAKIMPVFAFAHMGKEYIPKADAVQESIAHTIIDQGPEFLIANQSHWVQNAEVYKGKLIVFSTGNFIFDQLDSETNRGDNIAVNLSLQVDDNVRKWLALGKRCLTFHDDCFETAQQSGLKKVTLKLDYSVVASQGGYRELTHAADAATQKAVEQRMGWAAVCQALSAPYGCTK